MSVGCLCYHLPPPRTLSTLYSLFARCMRQLLYDMIQISSFRLSATFPTNFVITLNTLCTFRTCSCLYVCLYVGIQWLIDHFTTPTRWLIIHFTVCIDTLFCTTARVLDFYYFTRERKISLKLISSSMYAHVWIGVVTFSVLQCQSYSAAGDDTLSVYSYTVQQCSTTRSLSLSLSILWISCHKSLVACHIAYNSSVSLQPRIRIVSIPELEHITHYIQ